jgi:hypothetical protein
MKNTQRSLSDLATEAGRSADGRAYRKAIGKPDGEVLTPRELIGLSVVEDYRITARPLPEAHRGTAMLTFAAKQIELAALCKKADDMLGVAWALHNAATGFGWNDMKQAQHGLNKQAMEIAVRFASAGSDDGKFIEEKVSGSYPELLFALPLDKHKSFVMELHRKDRPDFAGHAVRLASREDISQESKQRLLELASKHEASKIEQREAAQKALSELEPTCAL